MAIVQSAVPVPKTVLVRHRQLFLRARAGTANPAFSLILRQSASVLDAHASKGTDCFSKAMQTSDQVLQGARIASYLLPGEDKSSSRSVGACGVINISKHEDRFWLCRFIPFSFIAFIRSVSGKRCDSTSCCPLRSTHSQGFGGFWRETKYE